MRVLQVLMNIHGHKVLMVTSGIWTYPGVGQLSPSTSRSDAIWGVCFTNINTANAIVRMEKVWVWPLLCRSSFFRAFDYFLLTQTFGGVPLIWVLVN